MVEETPSTRESQFWSGERLLALIGVVISLGLLLRGLLHVEGRDTLFWLVLGLDLFSLLAGWGYFSLIYQIYVRSARYPTLGIIRPIPQISRILAVVCNMAALAAVLVYSCL